MKYNMRSWIKNLKGTKKPIPLLSFPCVSLLGVTVRELIYDSELQAKGMKSVAEQIDAAAAVGFMDLSVEAECFGAEITVYNDEVPTVKGRLINDMDEAEKLQIPAVGSGRTRICIDTIKKAVKEIDDRAVFAGMIGPFSLASRLLDVSEIMIDCYDDPDMVHLVLDKVTQFLCEYAKAYKSTGANGVVIAEPVSGLLSPSLEEEFSSPYIKRIVEAVQDDDFAVIYHNCGNNTPKMLDSILSTNCAAYHFGNAVDIELDILKKVPDDVVVMGNIDPAGVLRMGTSEKVREETLSLLERCDKYPNFILSSGCDVPPMTPWENIHAFFDAAKEFYKAKLFKTLIDKPLSLGAYKASVIAAKDISLDRSFRDMCAANTCGMYGKCYMCPPDVGDIDEMMNDIQGYEYALVYQTVSELEDSFDYDGMVSAKKNFRRVSQELRKTIDDAKFEKVLHLSVGGCGVCEICAKQTGAECRYPELAMASLEAYGINVTLLASAANMKYVNGQNTVTYFGAVLFSLNGEENE